MPSALTPVAPSHPNRRLAMVAAMGVVALPATQVWAANAASAAQGVWPQASVVPGGVARLSLGPAAFKDDSIAKFHGVNLKVGDWVMAVAGDGIAMDIKGLPCRLYQDTRILMRVKDPSIYY